MSLHTNISNMGSRWFKMVQASLMVEARAPIPALALAQKTGAIRFFPWSSSLTWPPMSQM